jgi:three-Cys-motif partner protein
LAKKVKKYKWLLNESIPILDEHSKVKLNIIERYIEIYLKFLTKGCQHSTLKLSIIDGFSGGGLYKCGTTGSPIRIKEAVEKAQNIIKFEKEKNNCPDVKFEIDYKFIEKDEGAYNFLQNTLKEREYFCKDTLCIRGTFKKYIDEIIKDIQDKSRAQRCIFILDQYGYSDAPIPVINKIFRNIKNAEVILTFSVDTLIDYLHKQNPAVLLNMGLSKSDCEKILDEREDNDFSRSKIQPLLYEGIVKAVGAEFYTPFFIKSDKTNRSYWLFHFSSHPTARDEMVKLHWNEQNTFKHYGNAGLKMLIGYNSNYSNNLFQSFDFDDFAREQSIETLSEEIPKLIYERQMTLYGDLRDNIINETPATDEMIRKSLTYALDSGEISITSSDWKKRKKYTTIQDDDIIKWNKIIQPKLF